MMSELHIMAQDLIAHFEDIERKVNRHFTWSWREWWFNHMNHELRLNAVEAFLGTANCNEQILIVEAVQDIVQSAH